MPVTLQCDHFPLPLADVERLWKKAKTERNVPDDEVTIRCVSPKEIQQLQQQYRNKDHATNVLTFSYPAMDELGTDSTASHDVCVCMPVVIREAEEQGQSVDHYARWIVVHAFLHVTGMDHERSEEEANAMHTLEQRILTS